MASPVRSVVLPQMAMQMQRQLQEESDGRIKMIQEESVRERHTLVQAALKSLEVMRTHVQHTNAGVRMREPVEEGGGESFITWEPPSRWGKSDLGKSTQRASNPLRL